MMYGQKNIKFWLCLTYLRRIVLNVLKTQRDILYKIICFYWTN